MFYIISGILYEHIYFICNAPLSYFIVIVYAWFYYEDGSICGECHVIHPLVFHLMRKNRRISSPSHIIMRINLFLTYVINFFITRNSGYYLKILPQNTDRTFPTSPHIQLANDYPLFLSYRLYYLSTI